MIKKLITTSIGIIAGCTLYAQGINFEQQLTWRQIQAKAKAENKYIFVDAFATWCGPCKQMSTETFPKKEVGDFVNDKFISVKVQMDKTNNDSEYVKNWYADAKFFEQEFGITGYPTILFFSSDGDLVHRSEGALDSHQLLAEARKAIDKTQRFDTLYKQYKEGKNDSAFVKKLVAEATKVGRQSLAHEIAQNYIDKLNDSELFKEHNLLFAYVNTTKTTDRGFEIFKQQSARADKIFGPKFRVPSKRLIDKLIYKQEIEPHIKSGIPDWKAIEHRINSKYGEIDSEFYWGVRMNYANENRLWEEFGKYYALYYRTAYSHSIFHINNISWTIFQYVTDRKVLDVAIKTMKYNIEHFDQNNLRSYDTYANLLYKVGRKEDAILWESKAMKIDAENAAKENRKSDPVFAETLEKMKAGIKTWVE